MNENIEFYKKLKIKLENTSTWPSDYLFKFIVQSQREKIDAIRTIFKNEKTKIVETLSKKKNYTSVSILVNLENPDIVIDYYQKVSKIEGVISL